MGVVQQQQVPPYHGTEEAEHREPSTSMVPTVGISAASQSTSSSSSTMQAKAVAPKKMITAVKKTTTALKKKKKPKKLKFSSILSGMMQKSRPNNLQQERELLRTHLGGGTFRKVEQI